MINPKDNNRENDIAIIGIAGRFPGAADVNEFWQNIANGIESVTGLNDVDLKASGIDPAMIDDPDYVKARALLTDADMFDAGFFGFSPRDADTTDPQQRIFLEVCWEALESAGYVPDHYSGSIGVFAGCGMNTYFLSNLMANRALIQEFVSGYQVSNYNLVVGNDKDYLATRISYKLNLRGPAVTVQTACSTSLVAVCQAVTALRSSTCDMAIAGGVSISFPQQRGYLYAEGGMASSDGHCRAFDAEASGTVFGSGAGAVVLKRLDDALKDGDCIAAVIRGIGINNDGSQKVSYMAPSIEGQAEAIKMAFQDANLLPDDVQYIEAHGTGTPLGDPIEIAGLTRAFNDLGVTSGTRCFVGSLKPNIGHLAEAAGIAGLIKTVLALQNEKIPAIVHYRSPNPQIDLAKTPFNFLARPQEWVRSNVIRRAGVSSFGVGGTNAHVLLEESPQGALNTDKSGLQLLVLSARSPSALEAASERLAAYLTLDNAGSLSDVAFTLQTGRRTFDHRRTVVASNRLGAAAALRKTASISSSRSLDLSTSGISTGTAFVFPGQGSQHVNMARELYEAYSTFRADVDLCCDLARPHLDIDLRSIIFAEPGSEEQASALLKETRYTQPALFIIEYAMAMLWIEWGIMPDSMLGHSIGEYVAATIAGVFELPDALKVVVERGRLMHMLPGGSMLAIKSAVEDVTGILTDSLAIAAINSPTLTVVSGPHEAVDALEAQLNQLSVTSTRLHTSHAFHSAMVDPMLGDFYHTFDGIELHDPLVPFVSNVTGNWISQEDAIDPNYWVRHARKCVNFSDGVRLLAKENCRILEVGPGNTLSSLSKQCLAGQQNAIFSSLPHITSDVSQAEYLLGTLGKLWESGVIPDWNAFHQGQGHCRIPLPTYPFERNRHWVEPANVYKSVA